MGKDAQGLALVVFVFQLAHIILGLAGISEHQDGGLFDGPFKMVVADFLIGMPGPFAVGLFYRSDQAGIGRKVLDPGKRLISWISYKMTSARICPTPGIDRSRYRVW